MINSINQVFGWKGMGKMVQKHVASCDSCQRNKLSTLALRNKNPWDKVQVDCCGPWMMISA